MPILQSIPIASRRELLFRLSTAGGGPVTGQTFSGSEIQIRKAGGALVNFAGSTVEIGATALYVYTYAVGEIDTPGMLLYRVNKSGAILVEGTDEVAPAVFGTVGTEPRSASAFASNLSQANDFWKDALAKFLTGQLAGQVKKIGAFANTLGIVTLATGLAFTGAPSAGDHFQIIND